MFKWLRKGVTSLFGKIFLAIIVIVFIFWGIGFYGTRNQIIAKVNGKSISLKEFSEYYNFQLAQLKQTFGDVSPELLKELNFEQKVLQDLIEKTLLKEQAEKLGIKVNKNEVIETIKKIPAFQEKGEFSPEKYKIFLANFNISSQFFEKLIETELAIMKLKLFLTTPIIASTDEVINYLDFLNQSIFLREAFISFSYCRKLVKPTKEKIKNYFLTNRNLYIEPAKVKLLYVFFPFKGEVKISKEEIENYYKTHLERFKKPMKVKLVKVFIKGHTKENFAKAKKILEKAKTINDLKKISKAQSQWFDESSLPSQILEIVKVSKEGQIIGPIEVKDGYLILGIEKIIPESYADLSEVKETIEKEIKQQKLRELAKNKAQELYLLALKKESFEEACKILKYEPKSTKYLTKQALIQMVDSLENANKIFDASVGEVFPPMETTSGVYIFKLIEKTPPKNLTFEQAFPKVKVDFIKEESEKICKERATELIKAWQKNYSESLARKLGFRIKKVQTLRFKDKNLFQVITVGVLEEPIIETDGVKVIYIEKIKEPKGNYTSSEIESTKNLLITHKRETFWENWKKELLNNAKIKILLKEKAEK